jgi:hypothetical protein
MAKRRKRSVARTHPADPGSIARSGRGTLRSYTIGVLPILNRIFQRLELEEFFQTYLPAPGRPGEDTPSKKTVTPPRLRGGSAGDISGGLIGLATDNALPAG